MKKFLCLLLCFICLFGCENITPKAKLMTIKLAELNKDETRIVNLLNKVHNSYFYDFNIDSTVKEMVITAYKLNDKNWDILQQLNCEISNVQGRILMEIEDLRTSFRIAYEYDGNYGSVGKEIDFDPDIKTGGGHTFLSEEKIVLNHPILLATQINTEKKEVESLSNGTLEELAEFYSVRDYEEVYIVTLIFK